MPITVENYFKNEGVKIPTSQPVFIAEHVLHRINMENEIGTEGELYGLVGSKLIVLTVVFPNSSDAANAENYLPGNYTKLGKFFTFEEAREKENSQLKPYELAVAKDIDSGIFDVFIKKEHEYQVDFTIVDQDFINQVTAKFHIRGVLYINLEDVDDDDHIILYHDNLISFKLRDSVVFFKHDTDALTEKEESVLENTKGSLQLIETDLLYLRTYTPAHPVSPVITIMRDGSKLKNEKMCRIDVNTICVCLKDDKNFFTPLKYTLKKLIRLYRLTLDMVGKDKARELDTDYFFPEPLGHPVIRIYHKESEENGDFKQRLELLKYFKLAPRPYFRIENAVSNWEDKHNLGVLLNVHKGLKNCDGENPNVAIVSGLYGYYHYMQENFDDSGWGCAYRSLQTIFSWFKLQGYTNAKVVSHKAIQEKLVELKDKEKSFIGSKKWIGSTEVSYVLESMLGVSCRILNLSSGSEMRDIGSELMQHFTSYGTPIMIGGGQLAHTIIGVDYCTDTDAIKFLILDPHYVGKDEIKPIQTKGGIGWKSLDFWNKNAFYNLCMPILPAKY